MRSVDYGTDVVAAATAARRRPIAVPRTAAEVDLVVEERTTGFCGAVIACDKHAVILEDRRLARRAFPLVEGGFLLDGQPVTLFPPHPAAARASTRTASGSVKVADAQARIARAGRIMVEGKQDAMLVERVWGDDLRIEGVVVELLDGLDNLAGAVRDFAPRPGRRLGVLADHLVNGTKETRLAGEITNPNVLIVGHPYVDIWQAVKPAAIGIAEWPIIGRDVPWKEGICEALGERGGPPAMWRRILSCVHSYADLEVPLLRSVEQLIDFVTAEPPSAIAR
jgi:hypothetical protein